MNYIINLWRIKLSPTYRGIGSVLVNNYFFVGVFILLEYSIVLIDVIFLFEKLSDLGLDEPSFSNEDANDHSIAIIAIKK